MKLLRKLTYLLVTVLTLLLLFDSGDRHREQFQRCAPEQFCKSDSRNVFKMMLGGFSGLAADVIFLKCVNLQDEKRYDDIPALAEWIVSLQPDFSEAVQFWSSNLAWNISAQHGDYALRWQWVQHGMRLLKDVAIPASDNPDYYLEMARIYRLRIAEFIEPADVYFKTMLAMDMQAIMGGWSMEALAQSPNTVLGLNQFLGDGRFEEILKQHGVSEEKLYELFKRERRLPQMQVTEHEQEKIDHYLRRRLLTESTGIDPIMATEVNLVYGQLDWHIADSMAVYWAHAGKMRALKLGRKVYRFDRMLSRALTRLLRNGRLFYVDEKSVLQTAPNFDVVGALSRLFPDMLRQYKKSEKPIRDNYRNFLMQVVSLFYAYGREQEAAGFFEEYRRAYPKESKGSSMNRLALEVLTGMGRSYDYRSVQSLISGLYTRMFEFIGKGDSEKGFALDRTASRVWHTFKANPEVEFYEKDKLPPLKTIKQSVYQNIVKTLPEFLQKKIEPPSRRLKPLMQ